MKKLLLVILALAPLGTTACGLMGYIAQPSREFLERTEDMDHTAIIDLNNGEESLWFKVRKPAGLTEGSIVTISPIPAPAEQIHVNDIAKDQLPSYYPGDKVSHGSLLSYVVNEIFSALSPLVFLLLFSAFLVIIICCIRFIIDHFKKIPTREIYDKEFYLACIIVLLVAVWWVTVGFTSSSLGLEGSISKGIPTLSIDGMVLDSTDRVKVEYSAISHGMTMQVVSAENGVGLANYLERNGLPKSPSNEVNLSRFVNQGFNFVITYTPIQTLNENEFHYVLITFPSTKLFFPLSANYDTSTTPHPVQVLVLKPVTIPGYATDLTQDEQKNLNNTVSYYADGWNSTAPDKSVVHFFRSPEEYVEDVTMDIGVPLIIKLYRHIANPWVTIPALLILLVGLLYGLLRLPKRVLRGICAGLTFLSVLFVFLLFTGFPSF